MRKTVLCCQAYSTIKNCFCWQNDRKQLANSKERPIDIGVAQFALLLQFLQNCQELDGNLPQQNPCAMRVKISNEVFRDLLLLRMTVVNHVDEYIRVNRNHTVPRV